MKIIYVLGTDGAGKTTLARRLAQDLIAGQRLHYVYCQNKPLLHYPFLWIARALYLRGTNQFTDYGAYRQKKQAARRRRPFATSLYCFVGYLDFLFQVWARFFGPYLRNTTLILDRYYLDQVVNQGVLRETTFSAMLNEARFLERFLPKAHLHIFLDVNEEVAFARKNDIQSIEYLRERKSRYVQLAPHYDFITIDANHSPCAVYDEVKALVESRFSSLSCAS